MARQQMHLLAQKTERVFKTVPKLQIAVRRLHKREAFNKGMKDLLSREKEAMFTACNSRFARFQVELR